MCVGAQLTSKASRFKPCVLENLLGHTSPLLSRLIAIALIRPFPNTSGETAIRNASRAATSPLLLRSSPSRATAAAMRQQDGRLPASTSKPVAASRSAAWCASRTSATPRRAFSLATVFEFADGNDGEWGPDVSYSQAPLWCAAGAIVVFQ